jgi:hypothetical protein
MTPESQQMQTAEAPSQREGLYPPSGSWLAPKRKGRLAVRFRFNNKGVVVADTRQLMPYVGTDDYRSGMRIFAVRHSSPGRQSFKMRRALARASAREGK